MSQEVELNIPRTAEERLAAQSDWKCSGCGVRSPGRMRSCTCPTGVVWRKDPETNRDAHAWKIEAGLSESDRARELLASWMISHGYATGHGDSVEGLLGELEGQIEGERLIARALAEENSSLSETDAIFRRDIGWLCDNSESVRNLERAELARLRELNAALTAKLNRQAEQFDAQHGTPCEQIRHAQEVEALQSDITRKDEALKEAARFLDYFVNNRTSFVGPGAPKSCLEQVVAALQPLAPGSKGDAS